MLFVAWWWLGTIALVRLWTHACPGAPEIEHLLAEVTPAGVGHAVDVRVHPWVQTPCAFGLRRWRILLPALLPGGFPSQSIRFALAHEWSHLQRGDLWTWRWTRLAQLALWFQPAYWWLRWQVRLCQDYLADADAALAGEPTDFAAFLVESACTRNVLLASVALPLTSGPSDLSRRIAMLLNPRVALERRCPRAIHAAAALAVVGLLAAAAVVRLEAQVPPQTIALAQKEGQQATQRAATTGNVAADQNAPALTSRFRVVAVGTDTPIADAKVVVQRELTRDARGFSVRKLLARSEHTTDADGYYTLTFSAADLSQPSLTLMFSVSHPDYVPRSGSGVTVELLAKNRATEKPLSYSTTKLYLARMVTGTVLQPDGTPASEAKIEGYTAPPGQLIEGSTTNRQTRGSFIHATTEATGRFQIPVIASAQAACWVMSDNFAPLGFLVAPDQNNVVTLKLHPGLRTNGRVLAADGKPVAGISVTATRLSPESPELDQFLKTARFAKPRRSTTTDASGRFELPPVTEGKYDFSIGIGPTTESPPEYAGLFLRQDRTINAEGHELEFQARPAVEIRAKIVDADGQPVADGGFMTTGRIAADDGGWFGNPSTDPRAGMCVARVPRGLTKVQLNFYGGNDSAFFARRAPGAALEPVLDFLRIDALNDDLVGMEVTRFKAAHLTVKVVDAQGQPADNKDLFVFATLEPSPATIPENRSQFPRQNDGTWRSHQLPPNVELTITARKNGWSTEAQTVKLSEGEDKELMFVMTRK